MFDYFRVPEKLLCEFPKKQNLFSSFCSSGRLHSWRTFRSPSSPSVMAIVVVVEVVAELKVMNVGARMSYDNVWP